MQWTFNPAVDAYYVAFGFGKSVPGSVVWETLLYYSYLQKAVVVFGDKSRIDMYCQATLRINHTTANDEGTYDCMVDSKNAGIIYSKIQLAIKGRLQTYFLLLSFNTVKKMLYRARFEIEGEPEYYKCITKSFGKTIIII